MMFYVFRSSMQVLILMGLTQTGWAGPRMLLESPELPDHLPALNHASMGDFLGSYRRDWRDDTHYYSADLRAYCRRVSQSFQKTSIQKDLAALLLIQDLILLPKRSQLLDPQGLQKPLHFRLRSYALTQSLTVSERKLLNRMMRRVAHDRGELYGMVVEAQWFLIFVSYRQYNDAVERQAQAGGLGGSVFFGGNSHTCAALTLRAERNQVLSQATRRIEQSLQAWSVERDKSQN